MSFFLFPSDKLHISNPYSTPNKVLIIIIEYVEDASHFMATIMFKHVAFLDAASHKCYRPLYSLETTNVHVSHTIHKIYRIIISTGIGLYIWMCFTFHLNVKLHNHKYIFTVSKFCIKRKVHLLKSSVYQIYYCLIHYL